MRRIGFILLAFFLTGSGSLAFGQAYGLRYNPYNPYMSLNPDASKAQERIPLESNYYSNPYGVISQQADRYYYYERDYLTRGFVSEYRKGARGELYFYNPYGTLPRKWYDTPLEMTTGGGVGRGYEISGMLTSPYEDSFLRQRQSGQAEGSLRQSYSADSDYATIPYGSDPRKWYDTPMAGPGAYRPAFQSSHSFSSPFSSVKEAPSFASETLTSPFEKTSQPFPARMEPPRETTLELTPPALR
jgi:hypothetical protein